MEIYNISYRVVSVDDNNLLVEYSCDGCSNELVSIRKPYVDENLDDVVKEYSPVFKWSEMKASYADVSPDQTGSFTQEFTSFGYNPESGMTEAEILENRKKIAQAKLADSIGSAIFNGAVIVDGHEVGINVGSIALLSLYAAAASSDAGFTALISDTNGTFFEADAALIAKIQKEAAVLAKTHTTNHQSISSLIASETNKDNVESHLSNV